MPREGVCPHPYPAHRAWPLPAPAAVKRSMKTKSHKQELKQKLLQEKEKPLRLCFLSATALIYKAAANNKLLVHCATPNYRMHFCFESTRWQRGDRSPAPHTQKKVRLTHSLVKQFPSPERQDIIH